MSAIIGKRKMALVIGVAVTALGILLTGEGLAKLPEPDNIVYGLARDDAVTVSLQVQGVPIASYTMGENPNAGDFYILRVPMDALEPALPGTARPGTRATLFVNDEPAHSVTLGERGTIQRLDLQFDDIDGDGLPDEWEQQIIDADPNDEFASLDDVKPGGDFDGDGETNDEEWQYGSSPINAMSARRGDIDGDKNVSLGDAIVVLKILSGVDPGVEVSVSGDVNGDGKIGAEELLYISQKLSGAR